MQNIKEALSNIENYRGRPAILFYGPIDYQTPGKIYQTICKIESKKKLDFVIISRGGMVNEARNLALVLRECIQKVDFLLPSVARSAGTILCLSADQLIMAPLAQLSPIDGQIVGNGQAGLPPVISAEDIRAYYKMAEKWFFIENEEVKAQIFGLLSQRIFPATLGSIYRSDQLVREIGMELISYQLMDADYSLKASIIESLMTNYHSHEYGISRKQAKELGLKVIFPDSTLEQLMWEINETCRLKIEKSHDEGTLIDNLIASKSFFAIQESHIPLTRTSEGESGHFSNRKIWRIVKED